LLLLLSCCFYLSVEGGLFLHAVKEEEQTAEDERGKAEASGVAVWPLQAIGHVQA
jgi:hypothetical protein